MPKFSTPAILLRRSVYGDYDMIITFLTLSSGKITVIAKNAKKSRRRFAGRLELFALLNIECQRPRGQGMPVLVAASLEEPFSGIRGHVMKTAYASYWAELMNVWLEAEKPQIRMFSLLRYFLDALDKGVLGNAELSVIFQLRFLHLSGLSPDFSECRRCRVPVDAMDGDVFFFELAKGGILCKGCSSSALSAIKLSKGTVKQLLWIQSNDLKKAERLKFSRSSLIEGLDFLEKFVVFHVGRAPKSLRFLRTLRSEKYQ